MKLMVAFASPKRSMKVVSMAARHAITEKAELLLLRVIADPAKMGVVAELIASGVPKQTAESQINKTVDELKQMGVSVRGTVKIGPVAETLVQTAIEENVDMVYLGTANPKLNAFGFTMQDPIVRYIVDHCPTSLCIVKDGTDDLTYGAGD